MSVPESNGDPGPGQPLPSPAPATPPPPSPGLEQEVVTPAPAASPSSPAPTSEAAAAAPAQPKAPPPSRPHRERPLPAYLRPAPPAMRWAVLLAGVAAALLLTYMLFVGGLIRVWTGELGKVSLEKPFTHPRDSYSIQPPRNWTLHDRVPGASLVIKGRMEPGFSPLLIVALEVAPDRLEGYVKEHKSRLQHENPSIAWLSESDDFIQGMRAIRLEYECDYQDQGKTEKVRLKNLQYVIDSRPRFYRITGSVAKPYYERYLDRFEGSARTFQRTPLPQVMPQPLPQ